VPAAKAKTSAVVIGVPAMPQSPLWTSSTITQVTWRMFSPSIATIASVGSLTIRCFCSSEHTPSMSLTLTSGIRALLVVVAACQVSLAAAGRATVARG